MFSPYYAWAGRTAPDDHCAINVGLYGAGVNRWTMTERKRDRVRRGRDHFVIGPSEIEWDGERLTLYINERGAPLPRRVCGTVRVHTGARTAAPFALDREAHHQWWPIAPCARVEVDMREPGVRWSGSGYLDTNRGTRPLERDFASWDWSRSHLADRSSRILYDVRHPGERRGEEVQGQLLALDCATDGTVTTFEAPARQPLGRCLWGVERHVRCDAGAQPRVVKTLEDSPFYTRSVVETTLGGETLETMHESLSGPRFASPIIRCMLPFRMPRAPFLFW